MADRTFLDYTNSGEQANVWTNGFDRQDVDSMGTLSWDGTTRTVSLAVKSGESEFVFWCDGKKYTKTTTQSVVIPDTTDLYYAYFDNDGNIQYCTDASVGTAHFHEYALVALVRWNATQGSGGCSDERHGIRMSGTTHMWRHLTDGTSYESGMAPSGFVNGNATYTSTASGFFWDEDIRHTVSSQSTHGWLYRLGADGEWTTIAADNNLTYNGGSGDAYWNEWTGTTWQLTRMDSSHDYAILFFAATPSIAGGGVVKIMGHSAYASRRDARNAIETEMANLKLDGLPSTEVVFLYAVIVRRAGALQSLADGSTYYDLRTFRGGGTGASTIPRYASDIPTDTTNFTGCLGSTDTDVQTAIESMMAAINNTLQVS